MSCIKPEFCRINVDFKEFKLNNANTNKQYQSN